MELYQVRYFLALCDTLNFTKAAEKSNVSQPSLTRAIKLLEEEYGGSLFVRERKYTHLTELGQALRPHFEAIRAQTAEAKTRAEELNAMQGARLRIALTNTQATAGVIELVERFQSQYENVELHFNERRNNDWQEMVLNGECDAALSASPEKESSRFNLIPLLHERLMIGVRRSHRFARMNAVMLNDLSGEQYLACDVCEYAPCIDRLLNENKIKVARQIRSDGEGWVKAMASAGLGFCILPEHAFVNLDMVTRPLINPEITRTVRLLTAPGRPHSAALRAFLQVARDVGRNLRRNAAAGEPTPRSRLVGECEIVEEAAIA